jgi:hypothetical protein
VPCRASSPTSPAGRNRSSIVLDGIPELGEPMLQTQSLSRISDADLIVKASGIRVAILLRPSTDHRASR